MWLIIVVFLAGFLRFYNVASIPPALNSDEVAIGYNAYSILKTGRDEYNRSFPLTFRSFDDYKMPVYVYMVSASMALFGTSDFSVRFPSALFGTLTVLLTYFLVKEICKKNKLVPILAAVLLSVSPWHLMFSRAGYEANVSLFFIVFGAYCLLVGLRKGLYIPLSGVLFALSIWTYHTARIFVPLLFIGFAIIYGKHLWKQKVYMIVGILLGLIILFPLIRLSLSVEGQMRAIGVSSFANSDDLKISISRIIYDTKNNLSFYSFFHNRRFEYFIIFIRGYFSHFDLNFLFLDKAIEKYRAPGVGLLYLFELPLLCIGVYQLIRQWSKGSALLFWWIIISPVAAAFTLQLPHPVRTIVFLPVIQIIAALGAAEVLSKAKQRLTAILLYIFVACCAMNITYFFHQYFVHMPIENAKYWYAGRKEMVTKLVQYEDSYDRIIVSNQLDFPYIFFLYYGRVDPQQYQQKGGTKSGGFNENDNAWGKYEFRSLSSFVRDQYEKVLFVGLPGEEFKKSLVVDTIYYPDGSPAIVFFK
ncbi:MAG: glycosyltransferase family 39 protein [Candidatus Gottesmanbacteria bacterium]